MGKTKNVEAVMRALRVARAEFARDAGDLEATIKRRIPKCKKSLKKVRKLEKMAKELGGEMSEEVPSRSSLLGDSSSDSSCGSSESDAQVPVKNAEEAKPVAVEKPKTEKGGGKVVQGPASKKPPRRSKETCPSSSSSSSSSRSRSSSSSSSSSSRGSIEKEKREIDPKGLGHIYIYIYIYIYFLFLLGVWDRSRGYGCAGFRA